MITNNDMESSLPLFVKATIVIPIIQGIVIMFYYTDVHFRCGDVERLQRVSKQRHCCLPRSR